MSNLSQDTLTLNIDTLEMMIPILNDSHKKTPPENRINMLNNLNLIIDSPIFKKFEIYIVDHILPIILDRLNDVPKVIEIAGTVGFKIISKLSIQAFPYVLTKLKVGTDFTSKWKTQVGTLKLLQEYVNRVFKYDRDLLSSCLPEIIQYTNDLLYSTRSEVSTIAYETLHNAMNGITNKDLEPFVKDLIVAMVNREQTNETIQKIAGVVFVQTVEGSALSVVNQLILAGFKQEKAMIKRMCARIVNNMSKLVDEPIEAEPFLEDLIPALHNCIDTIANPEARNVAIETHKSLLQIQKKGLEQKEIYKFRNVNYIYSELINKIDTNDLNNLRLKYIAYITHSLIRTKTVDKDEYISELEPYVKSLEIEYNLIDYLYEQASNVISVEDNMIEEDENCTILCDCEFTLAYGTKILLHNTKMKLIKGHKYGLLGQNDCGKTTLMKAIADGSVEGFPDSDEVKTVFVEADIQGELSHLNCVNYVLENEAIKNMGATEEMVRDVLKNVGFTEGKSAGAGGDCDDPISSLSGGWRMKLALARAMLQKADILLMDEPTNHLDVKNVKWVESYINSLTDTTVIMVSHDSGLLNNCCNYIIQIDKLKLHFHKGNLSDFVETHPEANSYFEFKANKFNFKFPEPAFLDGIKSRGKFLLKLDNISLTYPGNKVPTISDITVRASMNSRVACVGVNGAGKSTMIKVLTGELEPTTGTAWKYPNSRIGYIAQHAFHHIEKHLDKTPNEYIRWRYEFGDDKEGLDKATMKLNEKDLLEIDKPILFTWTNEKGNIQKEERVISRFTEQRREVTGKKKVFEYEVAWKNKSMDSNSWYEADKLYKFNKVYEKVIKMIDQKILNRESVYSKPVTQDNVERHLGDIGLESEYATHYRISALSGGQKVKVVLAAALWDQPHILILDEPTNYLDRDSLGALAEAIKIYEGGVIMITHNDAFCRELCPERWVLEAGKLNTEGDVEWMENLAKDAVKFSAIEDMIDANGNEVKLKKAPKKLNTKEKKKLIKLLKQKIENNEELDSDEENYAIEFNL